MWSIGVIAYCLLTFEFPFPDMPWPPLGDFQYRAADQAFPAMPYLFARALTGAAPFQLYPVALAIGSGPRTRMGRRSPGACGSRHRRPL